MLKQIFSYKQLYTFFYGISSGLPLLLTLGTLQAWMTDANVDIKKIGLMSSVTLPYSLKMFWAPLIDRYVWPFLGRRRGWIVVFQVCVALAIALIGTLDPMNNLMYFAVAAMLLTFFSASQDIVIDSYRREILADNELGLGSSMYIMGYRIGMIMAGAMALKLAHFYGPEVGQVKVWSYIYYLMAGIMLVFTALSVFAPKESDEIKPPASLKKAIIEPVVEFLTRKEALWLLSFILLYKIGDSMASTLTTPFILKMGYTKNQLADIGKIFGMIATIGGGFLGGVIILKWNINRSLWIFGILQAVSTYGFSLLSMAPVETEYLAAVIAFENLASGMGTAAYAAFMAKLTDVRYTATQYALLTSLMALPRTLISAPTGYLAEAVGWNLFFLICTVIAIPGMLLLFKVAPWNEKEA